MAILDSLINTKPIIDALATTISKLVSTPEEKAQAQALLEKLEQNPGELQVELNKLSLQNASLFISGWRSWIGWLSGSCVGLYYIPQFIIADYLWLKMCLAENKLLDFPLDPSGLMNLIYLLLGFGAYRTIDYHLKNKR